MLTSSSTLTLDFIKPLFVKDMSEKKAVNLDENTACVLYHHFCCDCTSDPPAFIAQLMVISWGCSGRERF